MPTKSTIRMRPRTARTCRAFCASGVRNAGTPSDTASIPVSAAHPEANARSARKRVSASAAVAAPGRRRRRAHLAAEPLDEPPRDHREIGADEHVGRRREQAARLPHAPQVGERDGDDPRHAERHAVGQEGREGGGDGVDARRHADRDREDVVDQQGGARDQARIPAEVLAGHDVGPAPLRVGEDRLPEGGHDDRDQEPRCRSRSGARRRAPRSRPATRIRRIASVA